MLADLGGLLKLVNDGGLTGVLLLVIVALAREYRREQRKVERWQRLALDALTQADHGAGLAEFYRGEQ